MCCYKHNKRNAANTPIAQKQNTYIGVYEVIILFVFIVFIENKVLLAKRPRRNWCKSVMFFYIWNEMESRDIFLIQKLWFFVNLKKPFLTFCKTRKKSSYLKLYSFCYFFSPEMYVFLFFLRVFRLNKALNFLSSVVFVFNSLTVFIFCVVVIVVIFIYQKYIEKKFCFPFYFYS